MKTHDVEEMLGMTKQTLIYYEKEGFITPSRDENNYRNYSQNDIDILKLIQLLRSMELSIDDVKLILNNELSIREALESKKEFIKHTKLKLDHIDQRIKEYIKRNQVKVSFNDTLIDEYPKTDTLFLNNGYIQYNHMTIQKNQILNIDLSMCSSIGLMRGMSVFFNYYVDIDIHTSFDTYSFQIMNNDKIRDMFDYFKDIKINDPLNLIPLYKEKTDTYALYKYLDLNFKKWAKQYHLDNPRDNYLFTKYDQLKDTLNDEYQTSGFHILKTSAKK